MSVGGDAEHRLARMHNCAMEACLIQLGRDADLWPKEARAWLVVAGLISYKPQLRKSVAGFVRVEHLMRDAESLRCADRVADEIGLAMNRGT